MEYYIVDGELRHHGTKGMKWGVRRYQNKDGSLTALGKKRRGEGGESSNLNLSRDVSPATVKNAIKSGLLDKNGRYLTEKGHLSEVARRKKLSPEESDAEVKALCKDWLTDLNDSNYDAAVDRSARVYNEIYNFVGSWYDGEGRTERVDRVLRDYDDARDNFSGKRYSKEWDRMCSPFYERMSSEVLKELGYSDTETGRKYVEPLWNAYGTYDPDDYVEHSALGESFVSEYLSTSSDELAHHGTKGMKWGVRRYQNKDGSLTAAGRVRYGAGKAADGIKKAVKGTIEKSRAKKAAKKESERIQKLMKKPIKKLTESELAERTALAKKQKELRQIESDSKRLINDGQTFAKKFGSKMVNEALIPAAISAGKSAVTKLLTNKLEKTLGVGGDDIKNSMDLLKKPLAELTDSEVKTLSKRYENISTIKKGRNAEKTVDKETGHRHDDDEEEEDED